ncbi:unnamed protein product [Rhizopus stolonifer]
MQEVNGIPIYSDNPILLYDDLDGPPTWFSAQGGVYKCKEKNSSKQVAIKKYLVEENKHEDMFVMPKELVENEIYIMTKCIHPNILKLMSAYIHQEFVYLVMPLCTGGSLQHYVFEYHLSVGQLIYIIQSIAAGLEELHRHGCIHRDIKCDNIFLNVQENSIVIGDFGVVSISPEADSSIEEAGVVLFWAPELVKKKIVNAKIDIWALGIVILEILNGGKAPYEDEHLREEQIKEKILQARRPAYPPKLPVQLVDLLDRCLDPNPETRYSASQVMQHPFLHSCIPELLFPSNMNVSEETKPKRPPAQCRIPIRSVSWNKQGSSSIPVNETILNVYRRRQSLSDSNRSQGSRLPMMCAKKPAIEPPVVEMPIVETLLKSKPAKGKRPLVRTNTMPPAKKQQISSAKVVNNYRASVNSPVPAKAPMNTGIKSNNNTRNKSPINADIKSNNNTRNKAPKSSNNTSNKASPKSLNNSKKVSPKSPNNSSNKVSSKSPTNSSKKTSPTNSNREISPESPTNSNKKVSPKSPNNISNKESSIKSNRTSVNTTNRSGTTKSPEKKPRLSTAPFSSSIPAKASIYRNKKPSVESRTARLMMGISTGRRQSYKTREQTAETSLPTLAHKQSAVKKQISLNTEALRVH